MRVFRLWRPGQLLSLIREMEQLIQINPFGIWHKHPRLKTIQCEECNRFYNRGHWIKDAEGFFEHCRWCGQGGNLLGCDECVESFCRPCIQRNLGRAGITEAECSSKWQCYICQPDKIKKLISFAKKLEKAGQQRSEWLTEKERKNRERRLAKLKATQQTNGNASHNSPSGMTLHIIFIT